jgi:hypothetical protein
MKQLLLLFAALLLGHASHAQFTQTFTGALTAASATSTYYFINSATLTSCTNKSNNGGGGGTPLTYPFAAYTIRNSSAAASCVTFALAPACSESGANLFLEVYTGDLGAAYDRPYSSGNTTDFSALSAAYRGDAGGGRAAGTSTTFSTPIAAGETLTLIVATNAQNGYCSGYTVTASAPVPLPIELFSFTGQATPQGTALRWATASEVNNAGFVVERSAEGHTFTALGRVAGAGTSTQAHTYTYLDSAPLALSYYRLRQEDRDGAIHYSPVVAVRAEVPMLSVYPNPATNTTSFSSPAATVLTMRDALGRVAQVLRLEAGTQAIDLRTLPAGVYILTDETTHHTTRLVKAGE